MDRASGSGVFARDPDALLDLIELATPPGQTGATAWRVEGTLREFPKFEPVNIWFEYPVHMLDTIGCLQDVPPEAERSDWQKKAKSEPKDRQKERFEVLEKAFAACDMEQTGCVPLAKLINYIGRSKNTIRDYVDEHPGFERARDGVKRVKNNDLEN